MPICTSCNIEYEEDKKFCNYCGNRLTPKTESISTPKKVNRADEEKSEGKLFCPHCKITYEFGSSCIQCGAPLGRQTSSQEKEELEIAHGTQFEEKLPPGDTPQEQKSGPSGGKLICPICKIIYERGTSCIKCESALVPQTSTQTNGAGKTSNGFEGEEKPLQVQAIEEQLAAEMVVETPRKKLICPSCKIIYERGTSCVRCGAALVPQTPSKEKEKPKSSDIEINLSPSEPDGLEDPFLPRGSTKPSEASDRSLGAAPEQPSPPSPKGQDSGVTEQGKKREYRAAPAPELSLEEEFLQGQLPEQPAAKKSVDDLLKRGTFLSRLKKDYRRLCLEVGSIMIMILAGGYLLWSVYSYFTKPKPPEPRAPISKEVAVQTPPSSSSLTPPATAVAESGESKKTEGRSPIPKEPPPVPASLPEPPKTPSAETQEIGSIKTLLENVRQSNLKKDIYLFVSCYSSDFENMEERKRATVAYWEKFNYLDLSFDLRDLSISVETAKARVEWLIKTSSRDGGPSQQNKSVLDVAFKKEDGKWKIKEVKPAR
jgi:uncharacterized protein YbaR (Trm112 family)